MKIGNWKRTGKMSWVLPHKKSADTHLIVTLASRKGIGIGFNKRMWDPMAFYQGMAETRGIIVKKSPHYDTKKQAYDWCIRYMKKRMWK